MVLAQFSRNSNHNYLSLEYGEGHEENTYRYKMITHNRLECCLFCNSKTIDNRQFLSYEITSMQNMENLFSKKEIDAAWMKQFLYSLKLVLRKLEEYLLDISDILFLPQYIFWDMDKQKIHFVYYPYYEKGISDDFMELAEYLIQKADYEDSNLIEIIYELYEKVEEADGNIGIDLIIKILEKIEDKPKPPEKIEPELNQQICLDFTMPSQKEKTWLSGKKRFLLFLPIAAGLIILINISIWDISALMLYVGGVAALVAGLLVFFLIQNIHNCKHIEKNESESEDFHEEPEDLIQPPVEEYGKTMVFERCGAQNKLFGTGKHNNRIIEIETSPFIIGKSKEYADAVINDASVSRIHARFKKMEEKVYLEDMNSTNGTYKNGRELEPHEIVEISPEDELRFGNMQFVYR